MQGEGKVKKLSVSVLFTRLNRKRGPSCLQITVAGGWGNHWSFLSGKEHEPNKRKQWQTWKNEPPVVSNSTKLPPHELQLLSRLPDQSIVLFGFVTVSASSISPRHWGTPSLQMGLSASRGLRCPWAPAKLVFHIHSSALEVPEARARQKVQSLDASSMREMHNCRGSFRRCSNLECVFVCSIVSDVDGDHIFRIV
jgi:hypothetical protein